jgi:hypothetical protein
MGENNSIQGKSEKSQDYLGDLCINGRKILKWTLQK